MKLTKEDNFLLHLILDSILKDRLDLLSLNLSEEDRERVRELNHMFEAEEVK